MLKSVSSFHNTYHTGNYAQIVGGLVGNLSVSIYIGHILAVIANNVALYIQMEGHTEFCDLGSI
jgi:hypothetical protein